MKKATNLKNLIYKMSRVNGEDYLQIWEKVPDSKPVYLGSVGPASGLYKILVKAGEVEN